MIQQKEIQLPTMERGIHLVTNQVLNAVDDLPENGLMHVFIKHTSAALALNENADPSVRDDLNEAYDRLAPENMPYYTHTAEGSDDMPGHIKAVLTGASVSFPITNGKPNLGTWQGIYLCEFRDNPGRRKLVVTIYG